eukprot:CAMPEP_0118938406 /NCGR_PEP_ID=MMETSP1169-20130426/25799_1 /TAXON_ID=36882 /ORGANISM="Pyramimonas obovata, Strain CCMP722" /LENGTH=73 /DNA_ID=CAMNT_0006882327 /DNA_START=93 /DNA_END=314 /DNA_ORIENTATION=-
MTAEAGTLGHLNRSQSPFARCNLDSPHTSGVGRHPSPPAGQYPIPSIRQRRSSSPRPNLTASRPPNLPTPAGA